MIMLMMICLVLLFYSFVEYFLCIFLFGELSGSTLHALYDDLCLIYLTVRFQLHRLCSVI
jgi:hypothetical protein